MFNQNEITGKASKQDREQKMLKKERRGSILDKVAREERPL